MAPPRVVFSPRSKRPLCPCCHNFMCDGPALSPSREPAAATHLLQLPDEILCAIGTHAAADLRSLALVNKQVAQMVQERPEMWRAAYQSSTGDDECTDDAWGADALPDFLWRACLIRTPAHPPKCYNDHSPIHTR